MSKNFGCNYLFQAHIIEIVSKLSLATFFTSTNISHNLKLKMTNCFVLSKEHKISFKKKLFVKIEQTNQELLKKISRK